MVKALHSLKKAWGKYSMIKIYISTGTRAASIIEDF